MMNNRALASLDHWLTTPPDDPYDDEHVDYLLVIIYAFDMANEYTRHTFKRMLNESVDDLEERAVVWAKWYCNNNGLDYDVDVDVDIEYF